MATRKVEVAIVGDSQSMVRAFRTADAAANRFDGKSNKLARTMRVLDRAVMVGAAAVGVAMVGALKNGFQGLIENEAASKQTAAAIKSTGGAANVTAGQIESLADSIEKKSGMDALAIQEGQNLLLTFTKIRNEAGKGNDIFDQTTKIMADVSTAMGTEPKVAAIQLGKALNDPVKGIGALSRVGIQFTEQQKEQIRTLVESGDVMGAQKIILKELETQFGGSAEAAGETFAGRVKILKARFDEFTESLAAKLMPVLMAFMDWVERNWPAISSAFEGLFNALVDVGRVIGAVVIPPLKAMFEFMSDNREIAAAIIGVLAGVYAGLKLLMIARSVAAAVQVLNIAMLANPFVLIAASVAAVAAGLVILWKKSETFRDTVTGAWNAVKAVVGVFVDFFKGPLKAAFDIISGVVKTIAGLLRGDFSAAWDGVKQAISGIASAIKEAVLAIPGKLLEAAVEVGQAAFELGKKIFDKILEGIGDLPGAIKRKVSSMFGLAGEEGAINPYLPAIKGQGKKITAGVRDGIDDTKSRIPNAVANAIGAADSETNREKASTAGHNVGEKIGKGIASGLSSTHAKASSAVQSLVDFVVAAAKKRAGVKSPSRLFANEVGAPISQGIAMGITDNADAVSGAIGGLIGTETSISAQGAAMRSGLQAASGVTGGGAVINLTFNGVLDAREAARVIQPELNRLITTTY